MLSLQCKIISITNPVINPTLKPAISIAVRYFSPKSHPYDDGTYRGEKARRCGYEAHHLTGGTLPRLNKREVRLPVCPISAKEDYWSSRLATMGKNDFIKIMGDDENFQQHELLNHIPDWLRGYENTSREYSVLMRKRKEFDHWKYSKPLKWLHMERRIKYLYNRINNKYKPPQVEKLVKSRYCL